MEKDVLVSDKFGQIRTLIIDGEVWYLGNDIAKGLNYRCFKNAVNKHVDKNNKKIFDLSTNGGVQNATYIDKKGAYILISDSKLSTMKFKKEFLIFLGLDENKIICNEREEISFINELTIVLKELGFKNLIKQYKCLNYKIDLYLPNENIVIEYDENNHRYYSYDNQELRQLRIKNQLRCKFIRVSDKFTNLENIGKVIKKLYE